MTHICQSTTNREYSETNTKLEDAMDSWGADEAEIEAILDATDSWGIDDAALETLLEATDSWGADETKFERILNTTDSWGVDESEIERILKTTDSWGTDHAEIEAVLDVTDSWGVDEAEIRTVVERALNDQDGQVAEETVLEDLQIALPREKHDRLARDVPAQLRDAMDAWGADEAEITALIRRASGTQRRRILDDAALLCDLRASLTRASMREVLDLLGASLAEKLSTATDAWGASETELTQLVETASERERRAVARDEELLDGLQTALPSETFAAVSETLRAATDETATTPQQLRIPTTL